MSDPMPQANPNAPLRGTAARVNDDGLMTVVWVCFLIATLFVSLRLFVRARQNRTLFADDYWVIFAWASLLTMASLQTVQMESLWFTTYLSAGRIAIDSPDMEQLVFYHLSQLTRWQFPVIKLFWTVLWAIKASFLSLIYRLVQPFPTLRRLWFVVVAFVTLAYIGCWVASVLTCNPVSDYFVPGMSILAIPESSVS
jgi:hypothetical protein